MKEEAWSMIFSTSVLALAEIQKAMLEENGIVAVILNKQDSSYLSFGFIEVYVLEKDKSNAQLLIEMNKDVDE
jgi:uncharacterized membrane protein YcaP (DUF421 family)